ncbi:MAG: PRC-barrel domain-containing protein [Bdellovibrionales bacterium]
MNLTKILLCTIIMFALSSMDAMAQNNREFEQLSTLNRIKPLQNPEFDRVEKVLDRKILDRKNKVVGTVQDVILNQNGTISGINTEFDRLRLGNLVSLNFRALRIRTTSDAYQMNMDADEIADMYPRLLADIETASGRNNVTFSTRAIIGSSLRSSDGRRLGKVENVLFGADGGIASAIYAKLSYGTLRGETVAVPFRNVEFKYERGRLSGTVSRGLANAMFEIADD